MSGKNKKRRSRSIPPGSFRRNLSMTRHSMLSEEKSKYQPKFADDLKMLVIERGMVNSRGEIAEKDFARLWRVSERLIRDWKNPRSKYYQPEFAKMWAKCQKAANAGQIKKGLIEIANWHKTIHTITETTSGPEGKESKTRRETIRNPPNVNAAKICLHNLGKAEEPDERWNVKEQIEQSGKIETVYSPETLAAAKKAGISLAKEVRAGT